MLHKMDFSTWLPMNGNRLIAPILILCIVLSGCAAKHASKPLVTPKPPVTSDYKLGHRDGYNAAIDHPRRMIDFTNDSYHTNLTLPEAVQKQIHNKPVEYQRGFTNGWKVSKERKSVVYSIIHSNPPIIIEHDGTRDGRIVPHINHQTKIGKYKRKPQ